MISDFEAYKQKLRENGYDQGRRDETRCALSFIKIGCSVEFSNKEQNVLEHWDLAVTGKTGDVKWVEVKGLKRGMKSGFVDLEVQGISGYEGWIYGKSDYVCFETNDDFVVVRTPVLRQIVRENFTNWDSDHRSVRNILKINRFRVEYDEKYKYDLWRRNGNLDYVGFIPFEELKPHIEFRLKKVEIDEEVSSI